MTYKLNNITSNIYRPVGTKMIEITLSASQTLSAGGIVVFDTLSCETTPALSLNTSTGEITLASNKSYYIEANIDVTRSSTTSSLEFAWIDSGGTVIPISDGGFDANWVYHSVNSVGPTSTNVANYITNSPTSAIRLKAITLNASSTILQGTRVFIIEVDQ